MAEGLIVKVTHAGLNSDPILLTDVEDGVDFLNSFRKAGPVYVPVGGSVQLVYTRSVAISFESGAIRKFVDAGYLTAEIIMGDSMTDAVFGASTDTVDVYINGVSGDDSNDGLTSSTPVKTWAQARTLIPRVIVDQVVTVHFSGATYDCDTNGIIDISDIPCIGKGYLKLLGGYTAERTGTLTDGDPLGDQLAMEDNVGGFTAADVGRLIYFPGFTDEGWSHYVICDLVNPTTIRPDRPDMTPVTFPAGEAYEIQSLDTIITASTGTAIRNTTEPNPETLYSTVDRTRLQIEGLRIKGGVWAVGADVIFERCVIYQGNDKPNGVSYAVSLNKCTIVVSQSAALYDGVPTANDYAFNLHSSEFQSRNFELNVVFTSLTAFGYTTSYAVNMALCEGYIWAITAVDCAMLWVADSQSVRPTIFQGINTYMGFWGNNFCGCGKLQTENTSVVVWSGYFELNQGNNPQLRGTLDGGGATGVGIQIENPAVVRIALANHANACVIQNFTTAGIDIKVGGALTHNRTMKIQSNAIGLRATGATIGTSNGTISCQSNTGDGAYLKNCRGAVKFDNDNNGGWGLQALKASQLHDLGSTFAGNVSGATNVDASSNFVA